jgi:hypothetical protein
MTIQAQPTTPVPFAAAECPSCGTAIAPRVRLTVERIRAATKRPITPEMVLVCGSCAQSLVIALAPTCGRIGGAA